MSYPKLYLNDVNMHWSGLNGNETQGVLFSEPNIVIYFADWVVVSIVVNTMRGLGVRQA
jgi:hypothetical protein